MEVKETEKKEEGEEESSSVKWSQLSHGKQHKQQLGTDDTVNDIELKG